MKSLLVAFLLYLTTTSWSYVFPRFYIDNVGQDYIGVKLIWGDDIPDNGTVVLQAICLGGCPHYTVFADLDTTGKVYNISGLEAGQWYGVCTEYKSDFKGSGSSCDYTITRDKNGKQDLGIWESTNFIKLKEVAYLQLKARAKFPIRVTVDHDVYPLQVARVSPKNPMKIFRFPKIPGRELNSSACYTWEPDYGTVSFQLGGSPRTGFGVTKTTCLKFSD